MKMRHSCRKQYNTFSMIKQWLVLGLHLLWNNDLVYRLLVTWIVSAIVSRWINPPGLKLKQEKMNNYLIRKSWVKRILNKLRNKKHWNWSLDCKGTGLIYAEWAFYIIFLKIKSQSDSEWFCEIKRMRY